MRVAFLVDGFNLYHSLDAASAALDGRGTKWLDLVSLCEAMLSQVGGGAKVASVHFFSSPPDHIDQSKPGALDRHRAYVSALKMRDVLIELGKFKAKQRRCPACGSIITSHEEKETDVAIAVRMMELLWNDRCDAIALVTADSDLSPAIREARASFPNRPVYCCFPFGRGSDELRRLASKCFRIRKERYVQHQLPDRVESPSGVVVRKPAGW